MKHALIIGASGGIGTALTQVLRTQGVAVTELSRQHDGLDLMDAGAVDRILGGLSGQFDVIVTATGALDIAGDRPEKSLRQITPQAMANQFAVNAIGPALILRHVPRLLARAEPAVMATLTARVGSIGDNHLGGWYSYRAAKAAANQIVRTAAIEIARTHPKAAVVALHPGTVATRFTANYQDKHPTFTPQTAAENLIAVLQGLTPNDTGQIFDWAGKPVPW